MTEEPETIEPMSVSQYYDLKAHLNRIETLLTEPDVKPVLVGLKGLQKMLGCSSPSATARRADEFGIKSLAYGKYRIRDVENAIARKVIENQAEYKASQSKNLDSRLPAFNGPDSKWEGKQ